MIEMAYHLDFMVIQLIRWGQDCYHHFVVRIWPPNNNYPMHQCHLCDSQLSGNSAKLSKNSLSWISKKTWKCFSHLLRSTISLEHFSRTATLVYMAVKPANTSIWTPQISMITCTNEADLYFTNEIYWTNLSTQSRVFWILKNCLKSTMNEFICCPKRTR